MGGVEELGADLVVLDAGHLGRAGHRVDEGVVEAAEDGRCLQDLLVLVERRDGRVVGALDGAALYQDKEVLEATPFFGSLYDTFVNAVARPSKVTGAKYNQVSSEFFNAAHDVLSGKSKAAARLKALERKLDRLSRGGRW